MLLILLFLLSIFFIAFVLWIPYRLVQTAKLSTRLAVRTWAIYFFGQLLYLTCTRQPWRIYPYSLISGNGYRMIGDLIGDVDWVVGQIGRGKGRDYLLFVLLPLVPAAAAFLIGYLLERYRRATPGL
ncbi:hypothetical protein [Hymenobacter sp. HDW8]|uniref:hypothetical protein n=1 Tax=Hymenobacter sp. HDW8 TaxID=2714932 RepID=UPI00140C3388|nr:hypothetical protein [Hymenobacter sp. HDW8]QIL78448.1 hypothetical protein G7064_21750 [Hymenobacter sp. HDW8]